MSSNIISLIEGTHILVTDADGIPLEQNNLLVVMNTRGKNQDEYLDKVR